MLSAGFCHLLADSLRQLSFIGHFPIATFLAALGYILTLLADQVVQMVMERDGAPGDGMLNDYKALAHASPQCMSPDPCGTPVAAAASRHNGNCAAAVAADCNGSSITAASSALGSGGSGGGGGSGSGALGCSNGEDHRSSGRGEMQLELQEVSLIGTPKGAGVPGQLQPICCPPFVAPGKQHSPSIGGLTPRHVRGAAGAAPGGSSPVSAHGKQQQQQHGHCCHQQNGGHEHSVQRQHSCHMHETTFEHVLDLEMTVAAHNHFQVGGRLPA